MVAVDLRSLVGKMNAPCRGALEAAAGYTLSRTHYNVEIEHWLLKLLDIPNSDLSLILRRFEVDPGRLATDLVRSVDRLKTGNARAPSLSPELVSLAREAWLVASLDGGAAAIRSGHLLTALLADDGLARNVRDGLPQLRQISAESLRKDLSAICRESSEQAAPEASPASEPAAAGPGAAQGLDQFTIDLTDRARKGLIDPVLGRDSEIRQVIDILMRRRQNNPILTGEAGVGKTAIVEGLALAIVKDQVPPPLKNVILRTLDLGLLQAGAGVKGEFENRLKSVIEAVQASPQPIVLFIDEAHTLIGAGGQAGQGDAANLLKPALARGDLRTVAATTWAEYKKYFERDAALTRRFQVVRVDEPSEEAAIDMLGGLLPTLEAHHKVGIMREALVDAVRLSRRYIPARQLPDKAVSVLDTACARVAISRTAIPPAIADLQRRIEILAGDIRVFEREQQTGTDHRSDLEALAAAKAEAEAGLDELDARWQRERQLADEIDALREKLTAPPPPPDAADAGEIEQSRARLGAVETELRQLQGETPLLFTRVDSQAVAEVISGWTGIPLGRMLGDEIRAVLTLQHRMGERVIGQPQALQAVAEAIRTSRAQLTDPRKPIGVFLMVGTSGVGKTETALTLAELLYGGEQNLTVINMSEFKEEHKVSMLLGAPPGYVGYGEGGVLTEAVRQRPYSVVLLDEMEKAHPGVQDVFYQLFDKGTARDGEGRDIDFKNTVIIMTSNAGSDLIAKLCADPETAPDAAGLAEALRPELLKLFKPAFLGRVTLVPYFPLPDEIIRSIVELQLGRIAGRISDNYRAAFEYPPALVDLIASRCHEAESGARNVEQILAHGLLPDLSARFLERMAAGEPIASVRVMVGDDDALSFTFD